MSDFKRIDPITAQTLHKQGAVMVDIRDFHSFETGHIIGSMHLDHRSLANFISHADLDKPLIVVCYHGHSSQSTASYLMLQGFSEVYSLDGGFELWRITYPEHVTPSINDE